MKWKNINSHEPKSKWILVIGKHCNLIHSLMYDYDEYILPETCEKEGHHFPGQSIDFELWCEMPLFPNQPERSKREDIDEKNNCPVCDINRIGSPGYCCHCRRL